MSPIQTGVLSKYDMYYMCIDVPCEEKFKCLYHGKEMTV